MSWRISFVLRPLDEVEPWGEPGNLSLSWFALSDGYYLIRFGDAEVFRYSSTASDKLGWPVDTSPPGFERSVDYQVCRLFHDLAEILPSVVAEVPFDIARVLASADKQMAWERKVRTRFSESSGLLSDSLSWLNRRTLDSAYLLAGPTISIWRLGEDIHVRADNRSCTIDGVKIWTADLVEHAIPISEFLREVHRFGDEVLDKMNERVEIVEAGWKRDGVRLNPNELRQEHEANTELWTAALNAPPCVEDWSAVREEMRRGGSQSEAKH